MIAKSAVQLSKRVATATSVGILIVLVSSIAYGDSYVAIHLGSLREEVKTRENPKLARLYERIYFGIDPDQTTPLHPLYLLIREAEGRPPQAKILFQQNGSDGGVKYPVRDFPPADIGVRRALTEIARSVRQGLLSVTAVNDAIVFDNHELERLKSLATSCPFKNGNLLASLSRVVGDEAIPGDDSVPSEPMIIVTGIRNSQNDRFRVYYGREFDWFGRSVKMDSELVQALKEWQKGEFEVQIDLEIDARNFLLDSSAWVSLQEGVSLAFIEDASSAEPSSSTYVTREAWKINTRGEGDGTVASVYGSVSADALSSEALRVHINLNGYGLLDRSGIRDHMSTPLASLDSGGKCSLYLPLVRYQETEEIESEGLYRHIVHVFAGSEEGQSRKLAFLKRGCRRELFSLMRGRSGSEVWLPSGSVVDELVSRIVALGRAPGEYRIYITMINNGAVSRGRCKEQLYNSMERLRAEILRRLKLNRGDIRLSWADWTSSEISRRGAPSLSYEIEVVPSSNNGWRSR